MLLLLSSPCLKKKKDEIRIICKPFELCTICSGLVGCLNVLLSVLLEIFFFALEALPRWWQGAFFPFSCHRGAPARIAELSDEAEVWGGKKHLKLRHWGFFNIWKKWAFVENCNIFQNFAAVSWHRALFGKNGWSYVKTVGCCGGKKICLHVGFLMYSHWDIKYKGFWRIYYISVLFIFDHFDVCILWKKKLKK